MNFIQYLLVEIAPASTIIASLLTIAVLLWLSRQYLSIRKIIEHVSAKTDLVIRQNDQQAQKIIDDRISAAFKEGLVHGLELERIRVEEKRLLLIKDAATASQKVLDVAAVAAVGVLHAAEETRDAREGT